MSGFPMSVKAAASVPVSGGFPMGKPANVTSKYPVPSGTGRPFLDRVGIDTPAASSPAGIVDAMIEDPAVRSELNARYGGRTYKPRSGQRWIARRKGECNKQIGWLIANDGRVLSRECGAVINEGDECWRQDGHLYYGNGCHEKGILAMPREFAGRFVNDSEFANNLPDRRVWLKRAENLWDHEYKVNLRGEWGTDEWRESQRMICESILSALRVLKAGGVLLEKPKDSTHGTASVPKPKRKAKEKSTVRIDGGPRIPITMADKYKPESAAMKSDRSKMEGFAPASQRDPAAPTEVLGVLKRFAGPNALSLAEGFMKQHNEARAKSGRTPFITMREGNQIVVVDPKLALHEAQRRKLPVPPYAEQPEEVVITPLSPTGAGTDKLSEAIKAALAETRKQPDKTHKATRSKKVTV